MNNTSTAERNTLHDATNEAIDKAEEVVLESMDRARDASDSVLETAETAEEQIQKAAASAADAVTKMVKEKPLQAAGIAFAAGVLVTLVLSRK